MNRGQRLREERRVHFLAKNFCTTRLVKSGMKSSVAKVARALVILSHEVYRSDFVPLIDEKHASRTPDIGFSGETGAL